MRQIRPSSPSGAVSCDTAKPWAGRWLSSTRTVHSASDIGTSMSPRLVCRATSVIMLTWAKARRHGDAVLSCRGQPATVEITRGGPRTRDGDDRARVQRLAAMRARRHRRDDLAAGGVPRLHGRAARGGPPVAPLAHRRYHVPQIAALAREPVLAARWVILVWDASE